MHDQFSSLNFSIYNSSEAVAFYGKATSLQPAELTLYEDLRNVLPAIDMVDVGVGAGRTKAFFAPHVKSYIGLDFAPSMVDAARARFPALDMRVADATNLDFLPDASRDLVLFSFNGLDCMTMDNRERALAGFLRLLRPGGHLIFSSHNINFLPDLTRGFRPDMAEHPVKLLKSLKRFARFLLVNRNVTYANDMKTALVFERHLGFEFPLLFIRPDHQIADLGPAGFSGTGPERRSVSR